MLCKYRDVARMLLPLLSVSSSSTVLVAIALIIIIGYLSAAIFRRTRVPELLILMLIGIFLVQVVHAIPSNYLDVLRSLAPVFGSLALIVIMLNASKALKFDNSAIRSLKGFVMGILDNVLAAAGLSLLMYYLFGWPFIYGAILGVILGETSSIVVIPFIRKVELDQGIFGILFAETTVNSILAIAVFSLLVLMAGDKVVSAFSFTTYVLDYLSFAIVMGIIAGIVWLFISNFVESANEYLATLAIAILLYGVVSIFNGAAIISILIFGMIMGNEKSFAGILGHAGNEGKTSSDKELEKSKASKAESNKANEKAVEKELEFLISTFFFVFMGMITELSLEYLLYGLLISFILIIVRYVQVYGILRNNPAEERKLAFALMPRGVTVATLATILYGMGGIYFMQIFYISFMVIVVTSVMSSLMLNKVSVKVRKSIA